MCVEYRVVCMRIPLFLRNACYSAFLTVIARATDEPSVLGHCTAMAHLYVPLLLLSSLIHAQGQLGIDCVDAPAKCEAVTVVVTEYSTATATSDLATATSDEFYSTDYSADSYTTITETESETYTPPTSTVTTTSTCTPEGAEQPPPRKAKRAAGGASVCRTVLSVVTFWPTEASASPGATSQ